MPDPITARVEPQAPSKEAMAIAQAATTMSNHPACHKYIATAIDAHTAAKDAEIERWKREALLARPLVFHGVNRGTCDRLDWESLRKSHEAARAANGATP